MSEKSKVLADHLAREIFKVGSDSAVAAIRIQFKGIRGDEEIGLGGFIEPALSRFIERTLNELNSDD